MAVLPRALSRDHRAPRTARVAHASGRRMVLRRVAAGDLQRTLEADSIARASYGAGEARSRQTISWLPRSKRRVPTSAGWAYTPASSANTVTREIG